MPVASFIICEVELVSAGRIVVLMGLGELVVFFGFRVAAKSFAGFAQAEPGGTEGGPSLGGAAIEIVGSGEILLRELHAGHEVQSQRRAGVLCEERFQRGGAFGESSQLQKQFGSFEDRGRIVRTDPQTFGNRRQRLIQLAGFFQAKRQIVSPREVFRVQAHGALIGRHRGLIQSMRFEHHAEIARSLGAFRLGHGLIAGFHYGVFYVRIQTVDWDGRDGRDGFRTRQLQQRRQYYGGDSPLHKVLP